MAIQSLHLLLSTTSTDSDDQDEGAEGRGIVEMGRNDSLYCGPTIRQQERWQIFSRR
jgi:hypothetical protein